MKIEREWRKQMRKYIKRIIKECLLEIQNQSNQPRFVHADRNPLPEDVHSIGTIWENTDTKEIFLRMPIDVEWVKGFNVKLGDEPCQKK